MKLSTIIDYIKNSPYNTNPVILQQLLQEYIDHPEDDPKPTPPTPPTPTPGESFQLSNVNLNQGEEIQVGNRNLVDSQDNEILFERGDVINLDVEYNGTQSPVTLFFKEIEEQ